MCGIAAILDRRRQPVPRESIERMIDRLAHRGPDGRGMLLHGQVALGHTRLSIVDPEGGVQPMYSPDGRYVIVYNGEIYNYRELRAALESDGVRFRTHSDTEVLVAAYAHWGAECLSRLRGMFALVVLDTRTNELFAARDRLGIKPLFWFEDAAVFLFASEMKALFASGRCEPRFDHLSVYDLLTFGHTLPGYTPFEGVREVPPGCWVRVDGSRATTGRYWEMPGPGLKPPISRLESPTAGTAAEELYARLREAVASHLIGDVPIASYLSGGIDSNSIAFCLKDLAFPVYRTYSMVFDVRQFDERQEIAWAARDHGFPNTLVEMTPATLADYADVVYHLETPQWWTLDAPLYALAAAVRRDGIKVAFSGQGSDELLAGYDAFRIDRARRALGRFPLSLFRRRLLRTMLARTDNAPDTVDFLVGLLAQPERDAARRFGMWPARFTEWHFLAPLAGESLAEPLRPLAGEAGERQTAYFQTEIAPHAKGLDPLSQMLYLECRTRLPNFVLWKEDRMNMAHGVETRPAFLDHELVEFCAGLPSRMKLRGQEEKHLLRQAMKGRLRGDHVWRRKRPFFSPVKEWISHPANRSWIADLLSERAVGAAGILDPTAVGQAARVALNGPADRVPTLRTMRAEWMVMFAVGFQVLFERLVSSTARWSAPVREMQPTLASLSDRSGWEK